MKQHLLGNQLLEINFEDRITLLSLVTGLTKEYIENEYKKGMKDEEGMLLSYGYSVKVGELIEIVEDYTGQFPIPEIKNDKYRVKICSENMNRKTINFDSDFQSSYCDALYEVVKYLLKEKFIFI
ncbi:hypothetical protein M2651_00890 [Clostridium sp. SYSU_GA19001]|uniref:hypothetical protein n=1 Tax=Clostridium caldaquaticum TaxID=2940653 RepID=UPI002077550C|nr:hypothetical protein [Clostridium caldaquaticum]MCM8709575.1 hypothetical protein [Clostridium caldaquaticum]